MMFSQALNLVVIGLMLGLGASAARAELPVDTIGVVTLTSRRWEIRVATAHFRKLKRGECRAQVFSMSPAGVAFKSEETRAEISSSSNVGSIMLVEDFARTRKSSIALAQAAAPSMLHGNGAAGSGLMRGLVRG